MPIVDQNARITVSTEASFDVFANLSLKPLLRFIAAECVMSMQQLLSGPGSNFPIVDFVVQLLLANKDHLEQACRRSNVSADASGCSSLPPAPSIVSASPDARDAGTGTGTGAAIPHHAEQTQVTHAQLDALKVQLRDLEAQLAAASASSPAPPVSLSAVDLTLSGTASVASWRSSEHRPLLSMLQRIPVASMLGAAALQTAASVSASDDSLRAFACLDERALKLIVETSSLELMKELRAQTQELRRAYDAMDANAKAKADSGAEKFSGTTLMVGSVLDFHSGLLGRLGQGPSLDFLKAMKLEHCERPDSNEAFTTSNYNLRTTPALEWSYAVDGVRAPEAQLSHERNIRSINELMQLDIVKKAGLQRAEVICVSLYSGPMFMKYNPCLRQGSAEGRNMFATTIFVLVSAVQKIARVTEISEELMLYCGLGNVSDLPESFGHADAFGSKGWTEFGFRSTTADKAVALDYSGVKKGNPHPMVMAIKPNSIDRGACIADLSQYQGEKEYLYVPCSFLQPNGPPALEVVAHGIINVIPVHLSLNLKTETMEELVAKKKRMHLDAARLLVDEVKTELELLAVSSDSNERRKKDITAEGSDALQQFAASINSHCEAILERHKNTDASRYVDDNMFRDLVSEVLNMKSWAKQKWNLWLKDESQYLSVLKDVTPIECHRKLLAHLRKCMRQAAPDSDERRCACLELLQCKGLVKDGANGELNAEGEDVIVAAGADGWSADDIQALIGAGADVATADKNGNTGLINAASCGHLSTMQALLISSCDMGKAVFGAASNGHTDCLEALIACKADVMQCFE
jgi:hypothetical protein